jgi:hypothetical protein
VEVRAFALLGGVLLAAMWGVFLAAALAAWWLLPAESQYSRPLRFPLVLGLFLFSAPCVLGAVLIMAGTVRRRELGSWSAGGRAPAVLAAAGWTVAVLPCAVMAALAAAALFV